MKEDERKAPEDEATLLLQALEDMELRLWEAGFRRLVVHNRTGVRGIVSGKE